MPVSVRSRGANRGWFRAEELLADQMANVLLVLLTDVVDELGVERREMADRCRPRPCVGLRIVHGDLDVEGAEVRAVETFGDLRGLGQGAAVGVQPHAVAE